MISIHVQITLEKIHFILNVFGGYWMKFNYAQSYITNINNMKQISKILLVHSQLKRNLLRDHFVYEPSQWETTLQCSIHPKAEYFSWSFSHVMLTHWGRMTHICVSKLTTIASDNGLSPDRRQAIIWTNIGMLLIWTLGTNFSEILYEIHIFSFKKMHLKMSSGKCRPFCLGLNVLIRRRNSCRCYSFPATILLQIVTQLSCRVQR